MKLPTAAKPAAPAPAPAAGAAKPPPPAPAAGAVKPTPPAAVKPEAPKAAGDVAIKKAGSEDPKVNAPGAVKPAAKDEKDVGLTLSSKNKPSKFYLTLAALTLIAILGTALITTLHYVKFEHQLDYTHLIPGLPGNK